MIKSRGIFILVLLAATLSACSINRAKRDADKPMEVDSAKPAASGSDSMVDATAAPGSAVGANSETSVTLLPAEKAKEDAPAQDLSKVTVTSADTENAKLPSSTVTPAAHETPEQAAEKGAASGGVGAMTAKESGGATVTLVPAAGAKGKKAKETPALKHVKGRGVDAKTARTWLEHGNVRFVKSHFRKDGEGKKDIARLTGGQHPHAIVLACSDSRVPPELVFDQRLGEIFVVRTLGEALDDNAVASIEYGLEQLGIKLIVVMGHNSCGAINAAIQIPENGNAGSAAMNHLVADIRPRIKEAMSSEAPHPDAAAESFANAKGIAEDLKKRSPIISEATESGDVVIAPALYHVENGKVTF